MPCTVTSTVCLNGICHATGTMLEYISDSVTLVLYVTPPSPLSLSAAMYANGSTASVA